jgi:aminoglycoside phosphotransferase (APT) family kinase protein
MDFFLSAGEIALLHRLLETIPDADTCVHFDLHTSNIMIRDGEPVIIDMGDLSRGHYLFDIGLLCTIYGFPETGICEMATKIPAADGLRLLERFLVHYFADKPEDEYRFFQRNKYFLAALRLIYSCTFLPKLKADSARIIKDTLLPKMVV